MRRLEETDCQGSVPGVWWISEDGGWGRRSPGKGTTVTNTLSKDKDIPIFPEFLELY